MGSEYFDGKKLFGDDFNEEQIRVWFEHEAEAYANLSDKKPIDDVITNNYDYHNLNKINGFNHIKLKNDSIALGIGAAYGAEFIPIKDYLKEIHILEPSDNLIAQTLENIPLKYSKPSINGKMPYEDNKFDIITCFGTLHHIPNVSFVMSELKRVLKPGGYLLIREPIISMGDWNKPRKGLTKYERGIPLNIFREIIKTNNFKILKERTCLTMLFFLQKLFKTTLYNKVAYLKFDVFFSKLLMFNYHYHATNKLQRIAPNNIFYILTK
jgi:ubiquinone/menaquinone biosynthesis C-methylase UbiE